MVYSFGGLFFRAADDIDAWQYLTFRGLGAVLVVAPIVWWQNRQDLGGVARRLGWQHATAGVLLGTMILLSVSQIANRQFFGGSINLTWADELIKLIVLWLAMVGSF